MVKKFKLSSLLYLIPVLVLGLLEFLYNRATYFVMDDLWYKTNLVTGEDLKSILDVFQSQFWHYFNWGGRTITHTFLQIGLMCGPLFCDIMNMIMVFLLCLVIASFARDKGNKMFFFYSAFSLIICFNASLRYNMFWQSGAVNYLYSSVWILTFIHVYLRELDEEVAPLKGVIYWIIPLGLITGWSNENMGPASFLLSIMVIFYVKRKKNYKRIPWWMTLGAISSFVGSVLVIIAPGNFVRSAFTNDAGLIRTILTRAISMWEGFGSFLMPALAVLALLFSLVVFVLRLKINARDIILLITAILAFGAMILSPHFPPRAVFGVMILCIVLILSLLEQICEQYPGFKTVANIFIICTYVFSIIDLYTIVCYYYTK